MTAGCNVLVGHCRRSNAALYYNGYYEFEGCIDYLLSHEDECRAMGENGVKYVDTNYSWKNIVERLNGIMTSL